MIKWFRDISSADVATCGGKGASLGELMRAGFPFSDGFVLTTDAFGVDHNQRKDEVYKAFDVLGTKYVAVRSSATKEDSIDDSFAGQFETYLFVDRENLIEQIMECHASINTDRIKAYCTSKGINRDEIKVAVVIQKMINSEVAGVSFTVNPVTNDTDQIIIEGGRGLGEAVVSGMVTPDNYVWSKSKQEVVEKNISTQSRKLVVDIEQGGIKEEEIEATVQGIQKLSDEHISALAQLSENIEQHYEKPMDIERAVEDGKIYILQARPITTIQASSEIPDFISDVELIGSRPSNVQRDECIYVFFSHWHNTKHISIPLDDINRGYYYSGPEFRSCLDDRKTIVLSKNGYAKYLKDYQALDLEIQTLRIDEHLSKKSIYEKFVYWYSFMRRLSPYILCSVGTEKLLDPICREELGKKFPHEAEEIFEKVCNPIKLTEYQKMILEISDMVINGYNDVDINYLVEKYTRYPEYRFIEQLWDYDYFSELLNSITQRDAIAQRNEILDMLAHNQKSFDEILDQIDDEDLKHLIIVINEHIWLRTDRVDVFKKGQYKIRSLYQQIASQLTIDSGSEYVLEDVLCMTNPEIKSYLIDDILPTYEDLIQRKNNQFVLVSSLASTDVISDQKIVKSIINTILGTKDGVIKGMTAYPGVVSGIAKRVRSKDDLGKITQEDIMIATTTFVEYTPAMKIVKGIVTDEGGITSHASIVARELCTPCIVGCKNAMSTLKDGDLIEVDANNGIVKILKKHMSIPQKILSTYKEDQWYRQRFDACPHFMMFIGLAHIYATNTSDYPRGQDIAYVGCSNNTADRYHNLNQLERTAQQIIQATTADPSVVDSMIDDFIPAQEQFYARCRTLGAEDLSTYTLDQLHTTYTALQDIYIQALIPSSLIDGFALTTDTLIANNIQDNVAGLEGISFTEVFADLTAPIFHSFLQEEEMVLLEAIIASEQDGGDTQDLIASHAANYFWIQNNYTHDNILDEAYFAEKRASFASQDTQQLLHHLQHLPLHHKQRKQHLIDELQLPADLVLLLRITDKFNEAQDKRKKMTFRATHYFSVLLEAMASHTQYSLDQLKYTSPSEIQDILQENIAPDLLDQRRAYCMCLLDTDGEDIITDQDLINQLDVMGRGQQSPSDHLSGFVACKGKVRGRVSIVESVQDMQKTQAGDVLVAVMTRPDYLPAMKKAAAFVTDEGGITCHAAIVAREMHKPCIIGTKVATQILQDGDIVEVDADSGVVKIVENNRQYSIQDWYFLYQTRGFSYLFCDICIRAYGDFDTIITSDQGLLKYYAAMKDKTYMPQQVCEEKYGDLDAFKNTYDDIIHHVDEMTKITTTCIDQGTITIESGMRFLQLSQSILEMYALYDHTYSDHLFTSSLAHKEELIAMIASSKNILRERINTVYFNNDCLWHVFFDLMAQQYGCTQKQLYGYTEQQIIDLLHGHPAPEEGVGDTFMLIKEYACVHAYTGVKASMMIQDFEQDIEIDTEAKVLHGQGIGTADMIQGEVRVFHVDYNDLDGSIATINQLEPGYILVLESTLQELIPAISHAAGIITDMGGMLSHAAITAREFNIPAVIGTQHATHILKDGDIVMLDATNGQITLI